MFWREKDVMLVIVVLLVVLFLLSLWVGVSLVRHPGENFLVMEKAEPRTLAWWDAYLGGWGFILLTILLAGCGLILLLALLHILPTGPSS